MSDEFDYGVVLGIVLTLIASFITALIVNYNPAAEEIGEGFGNQTCIEQGLEYSKIAYKDNIPTIICKAAEDVKHVDGTAYKVEVRP